MVNLNLPDHGLSKYGFDGFIETFPQKNIMGGFHQQTWRSNQQLSHSLCWLCTKLKGSPMLGWFHPNLQLYWPIFPSDKLVVRWSKRIMIVCI